MLEINLHVENEIFMGSCFFFCSLFIHLDPGMAINESKTLKILKQKQVSTSCLLSCDEMFPHQCSSSEFVCTRCICPQNKINEIMSVPELVLMVIKPRGCGRLDELIDRSAGEAAAGGGILMQEKWQRCDICWSEAD